MEPGKPSSKKIKTDVGSVFYSFHSQPALLEQLRYACGFMNTSLSGYAVVLSKIVSCDADCPVTFHQATCRCEDDAKELNLEGYTLGSIFDDGFAVLERYIESIDIPEEKGQNLALAKLLTFLSDNLNTANSKAKDTFRELPCDISKTDWAVRMAHHLLSKLSLYPNFKLDNLSRWKQEAVCSCSCGETFSGVYADTSIGLSDGWHGRFDILMDEVPVKVAAEDSQDLPVLGSNSSEKLRLSKNILASCRSQIRSEAIVNSFWVRKNHPEWEKFLIPNITVSREQVSFCFYDSELDVLMETPPLQLFGNEAGSLFNIPTIISLWLVLNFKFFCSGVHEVMKRREFTADFPKLAKQNVEKYIEGVVSPCCGKKSEWLPIKAKDLRREKQKHV